jgi:hypothetical protein
VDGARTACSLLGDPAHRQWETWADGIDVGAYASRRAVTRTRPYLVIYFPWRSFPVEAAGRGPMQLLAGRSQFEAEGFADGLSK